MNQDQEPSNRDSNSKINSSYQYGEAKGWDVKGKVKRSIQRVTEEIRSLVPLLPGLGPNATKREILRAARVRLESAPGLLTCPRQTMYFLTATFTSALRVDGGKLLSIESAWNNLIVLVANLNRGVAATLNTLEHKAAFAWQLAGIADGYWSTTGWAAVAIYENRCTNTIEHWLVLENGEEVPMPPDFPQSMPVFLPQASRWEGNIVTSDSLGNVMFESSYAPLDDALRSAIWEPKSGV